MSDIWDFTAERWGIDQAEKYATRIQDTLTELAVCRRNSRPADDIVPGYRKCVIGSHVAYFRTNFENLLVIRILHQSMDPGRQLP
jgi:toxin ParE1/3/4